MALQGHGQEEVRKEDRGGQVLVSFFLFFSWGGVGGRSGGGGLPKNLRFCKVPINPIFTYLFVVGFLSVLFLRLMARF